MCVCVSHYCFFCFSGQEAELDVSTLLQKIKEEKEKLTRQYGLCLVFISGFLKHLTAGCLQNGFVLCVAVHCKALAL